MDSQEMNEKGGISKPNMLAFGFLSHSKTYIVEAGIFFLPHFSLLKLPIFSLAGNMTCFQSFDEGLSHQREAKKLSGISVMRCIHCFIVIV